VAKHQVVFLYPSTPWGGTTPAATKTKDDRRITMKSTHVILSVALLPLMAIAIFAQKVSAD
jgi:hypothetical protein